MILHFHAADVLPGEAEYLNVCTNPENYNFDVCQEPYKHIIEVSREDLDAIYKELDFNCFWCESDLLKKHD